MENINVKEVLELFERAFGHRVNFKKSNLFFSSNLSGDTRRAVCGILTVEEAAYDGFYMGLPTSVARSLGYIKDKVLRRISGRVDFFLKQLKKY